MISKTIVDPIIKSGDLFQVFVQNRQEKRGKWLSPLDVKNFDRSSGTVTITGSNVQKIISGLEYTRVSIIDGDLVSHIMKSIGKVDANIEDSINQNDDKSISTYNFDGNATLLNEDYNDVFSNISSDAHSTPTNSHYDDNTVSYVQNEE